MTNKADNNIKEDHAAKRWSDDLDKHWSDTIWQRTAQLRHDNLEVAYACRVLRPTTGHVLRLTNDDDR